MSIRTFLRSLGGRAGNKTRSKGKVNTRRNKRASNKAIRKELDTITKKYRNWNGHSNDLKEYLNIPGDN